MEHLIGVDLGGWLDRGVTLVVAVVIALVVQRVIDIRMHKALDASNLPSASIFINIVRALIWALALLGVLQPVFGVDPRRLCRRPRRGLARRLARHCKDTISNIVSGISLMVSKSVQPGDFVTVGGVTGEVTDVTWRSTTVRMRGGAEEVIPNSVLSKTGAHAHHGLERGLLRRADRRGARCGPQRGGGRVLPRGGPRAGRPARPLLRGRTWSSRPSPPMAPRRGPCARAARRGSSPRRRIAWRGRSPAGPGSRTRCSGRAHG